MNQFDQNWKRALHDREMQFSPQVWTNVVSQLDQQKKRRKGFWWLFGTMGFIILSGAIWWSYAHVVSPDAPVGKKESAHITEINQSNNAKDQNISETKLSTAEITPVFKGIDPRTDISSSVSIVKKYPTAVDSAKTILKEIVEHPSRSKDPSILLIPTKTMDQKVEEERTAMKTPVLTSILPANIFYQNLPDCPVLGGRKKGILSGHFYTSLAYLPGYTLKHLSSSQIEGDAYLNERRNTEKFIFDHGLAFKIGYSSPMGLSLSSGVTYQSMHERFDFHRDSINGIITTITIDTVYNPDGTFDITRDTSQVTRLGRLEKTTYNRFKTLDIPILVGFEWDLEKWMIKWQGGVTFNLWLAKKGEILNPSLNPQRFDQNNDEFFKDQWGISLVSHIGAYYKINSRLYAMIEPSVVLPLKPITKISYPVDQRITRINLNLGIQYNF